MTTESILGFPMSIQKPLRQANLSQQVLDILVDRITSGQYPSGSQLPSEMFLTDEFSVSRATIRRAMDLLVARGLVIRRQGIGAFVTSSPEIDNPLNQFIDFREMVRLQGFKPGLVELSATLAEPPPKIAELMELQPDNLVLETHKYFTANDELVVYCVNHIPTWVFDGVMSVEAVTQPGIMEPILEFYEKRCGKRIEFYTCTIRAEVVKNCGLAYLTQGYKPDTPVLVVDEIGHDANNRPLHHSIEYHPGNQMQFGLVRFMEPVMGFGQKAIVQRAREKLNGLVSASPIPNAN